MNLYDTLASLAIILGISWAVLSFVVRPTVPAEVQQAEQPAAKQVRLCRAPTEVEQTHVVVYHRDGWLIGECLFVGVEGTYYRNKEARP